jgi:hypothetical protein
MAEVVVPPKLPCLSADQVLGLARACRVIGASRDLLRGNLMRAGFLAVASALALALALASCVVINTNSPGATTARQTTGKPIIRGALSGQRQILASFYAAASDCTSLGYPTLKVAKAPKHGEVSVEQGTALADFEKDDARNVCNGKSLPATVIYYTSEPGFIGTDTAEFERIGVRGAYGYHIFIIKVR